MTHDSFVPMPQPRLMGVEIRKITLIFPLLLSQKCNIHRIMTFLFDCLLLKPSQLSSEGLRLVSLRECALCPIELLLTSSHFRVLFPFLLPPIKDLLLSSPDLTIRQSFLSLIEKYFEHWKKCYSFNKAAMRVRLNLPKISQKKKVNSFRNSFMCISYFLKLYIRHYRNNLSHSYGFQYHIFHINWS